MERGKPMTVEKLAKQIFDECAKDGEPVTMEEAIEMAQMEIGAKGIKHEARSVEPKAEKTKIQRIAQVSDEKMALFSLLWEGLYNYYGENAQIQKQNKEISVQIGDKSFKIDIVEHRKPKA